MKTCIDKVCEGVLCDDECKDLKPSICGKNRELFAPENACGSIRIEGADDVEINQGVCIDLTEGVHAYDGNGHEIEYEVEPSEIGCCDVGEHEVTYTAIGSSKEMIPYIRTSKPMLGFNACGLVVKKVKRLVTILQALPPTIIGAVRTVLPIGASFDPMYGVSGIDDNGNATEVTFEGRYDVASEEADIVTFDSDVVQDLRSVKVSFEPIQDLNGYDKPWAGGAGKNLFNKNDYLYYNGYFDNGTITSNSSHTIVYIECQPDTTYTVSRLRTVGNERFQVAYSDVVPSSGSAIYGRKTASNTGTIGELMSLTITTNSEAQYLVLWAWWNSSVDPEDTLQIEVGSTATEYEPYENICPIDGRTEVEAIRSGKNIFGGTALRDGLLGIPNATDHASDGYVSYWANTQAEHNITDGMTFKENTQYTFIYKMYRGSATGSGLRLYYKDGTYVNMPSPSENYGTEQLIITSAEGKTVDRLAYYKDNGSVRIYYNESGIFEGDLELEDFEPYQADTYTSPLPQTVYGGTLDVVSGVLTIDRAIIGGSDWYQYASNNGYKAYRTLTFPFAKTNSASRIGAMSNVISEYGSFNSSSMTKNIIQPPSTTYGTCFMALDENIDASTVYFSYLVAEPTAIQLTPQEVKSLIGENNVWSEEGKVQVVYSTPLEEGLSQFDYEGVYPITYHTEDSCGNETDVTRYVIVGDNLTPEDTYGIACQGKACYSIIECDEIETFRTVIYEDGTLIINESSNDKEANIAEHGQAVHVYEAMKSDGSNYVFTVSSEDLWRDFSVLYTIKRVEIGSHIQPISTANWFYNLYYCEEMDLTNLDTSRVTDMENMFRYVGYQSSEAIQLLDLSHFDTRAVTNMKNIFNHMSHTKAIDVSSWDTSSATNMLGVFSYCDDLVTIYASNLFVPINPSEYGFFTDCYNLVGGSGTSYSSIGGSQAAYSTYARLDNPPNELGYFTEKQ